MRKLLFLFLIFFAFLEAKMVDGIAMIVEGQAITMAEIRSLKSQMGISKAEAVDLLIQDRLQNVAMKDIVIPEEEIDTKISEIAAQNHITIPKMQKILKQQGTPWIKYRTSIRNTLKKEHFFQSNVLGSIPEPTEDELKLFYAKHKNAFVIPKTISATEYTAKSKEIMTKFLKTHKKSYVKSRHITKRTDKMEPSLLTLFLEAQDGHYTKSINAGNYYVVYLIHSKKGKTTMPYEVARGFIISQWKQEQRAVILKDYFQKLRTSAEIKIIR